MKFIIQTLEKEINFFLNNIVIYEKIKEYFLIYHFLYKIYNLFIITKK